MPNPVCALCSRHSRPFASSLFCSSCSSAYFVLPSFHTFAGCCFQDFQVFAVSSLQADTDLHVHSKHAFSLGPLNLLFPLPGTLSHQISACSLTSFRPLHSSPYSKTMSAHCHFLFSISVHFSSQHLLPCDFLWLLTSCILLSPL